MEIFLRRVDHITMRSTSARSLRVLPSSDKNIAQKIVVGDHDGTLICFGVKKGDINIDFKTLPGTRIERVELGGALGSIQDKIFTASGCEVKGFSKKGKQFLIFDTNMSDTIHSMFVWGTNLHVASTSVYNKYENCVDACYFHAPDKINDMVGIQNSENVMCPVLGCQDRVLRVLDKGEMLYEAEVPGCPSTMALYDVRGPFGPNNLLYGTEDGVLGLCTIQADGPCHRWEASNPDNSCGVTSVDSYDMDQDGVSNIVVARDDGNVEVYSIADSSPVMIASSNVSETITSVGAGKISSPEHADIAIATYPGHVMSLTTEPVSVSNSQTNVVKTKIEELKKEIEALKMEVLHEREKYQKSANSENAVSAVVKFDIKDKFVLSPTDATYLLSLEIQSPIENVLLQCDVPVDLMDVDRNSAVVSHSAADPKDKNYLLATYRCQANTTRLDVKVRTIEGQYGTLQAYITPRIQPKTCQVKGYLIKPLSLHRRTHVIDEKRPMNELKLTGYFSLGEVHSWVSYCIPDVPEKAPPGETVTLLFQSTLLETQLVCTYAQNTINFRSDNISTISILKEVITKLATTRKIQLSINYTLEESSVTHMLKLIHPKLEYQLNLAKKVQLIDALREVALHEKDTEFMSAEYKEIMKNAEEIQAEHRLQPCHLERLYGMITDLFIDKFKFKGMNVKAKVPQLLQILDGYDITKLLDFFDNAQQPVQYDRDRE